MAYPVLLMAENDNNWFTGTMYVCLLNKPIELYHSTTYFVISYISLQIFNNVMETPDRVHVTKSMV